MGLRHFIRRGAPESASQQPQVREIAFSPGRPPTKAAVQRALAPPTDDERRCEFERWPVCAHGIRAHAVRGDGAGPNIFPPGSAGRQMHEPVEVVNETIERALDAAAAAQAKFDAETAPQPDIATVASEAVYQVGLQQLERDQLLADEQAEIEARLGALEQKLG